MPARAEMRSGRPFDRERANDLDADTSQAERQAERRAEQESALQRWETEGGAEEGMEMGAEDRTDGNEVAEIRRTDISEHSG